MRITTLKGTIGKKEPVDSSTLSDNEQKLFPQDWSVEIEQVLAKKNNHVHVRLGYGAGDWWFYQPHVNIITTKSVSKDKALADRIVDVCDERGYPLKRGAGQINIVGIEGVDTNGNPNDDQIDRWNDSLFVLEFFQHKPRIVFKAKCTTEPGDYYTRNPLNKNGCARLDTGYHKGLWQVGFHRGYKALVQGANVARLVRDTNRNHRRDDQVSHEQYNGINLHTTKTTDWRGKANPSSIGQWSAGCVVIYKPQEFKQLMKLIQSNISYLGNPNHKFDFILLWRDWLKEEANSPFDKAMLYSPEDLDILTRTIYGEARGESVKGKTAVAWVIKNRVLRSPKYNWPSEIAEVCQQEWQFSCWNSNDPNRIKLLELQTSHPEYKECESIARKVLDGILPDPTNGADHYYADYIAPPGWTKAAKLTAQIGTHLFFEVT